MWTGCQPSHYLRPLTQHDNASPPSLNPLSFPGQERVDVYLHSPYKPSLRIQRQVHRHSPIFTHGAVLKQSFGDGFVVTLSSTHDNFTFTLG
jgi:hypothetical protein